MNTRKIILYFGIWFVVVNLFALVAVNRVHVLPDTAYPWIDGQKTKQEQGWNIVSPHVKWDSFWYEDIIRSGYSYNGSGSLANIAFFPLYPLVVVLVSYLFFGHVLVAGWVVSSLCTLGALIVLSKLVQRFHPQLNSELVVMLLLIFPTAFFLNAMYTESLFLLLSVSSFYLTFKKQYFWAGVVGMLAALTRITGIVLFIPLLIEYFRERKFSLDSNIVPLFLIPLGTGSVFLFHYVMFGDPTAFFKVQSAWGRNFSIQSEHLNPLTNPAMVNLALDVAIVLAVLACTVLVYRKLRLSYAVYMLLTVGVALGTGTLMSIGRYVLVLFPIYFAVTSLKNRYIQHAWIFTSLLLFALYTLLFVNYYWAG